MIIMFLRLFGKRKRKKIREVEQWELCLLKNAILKLPSRYHYLIGQIDAGL